VSIVTNGDTDVRYRIYDGAYTGTAIDSETWTQSGSATQDFTASDGTRTIKFKTLISGLTLTLSSIDVRVDNTFGGDALCYIDAVSLDQSSGTAYTETPTGGAVGGGIAPPALSITITPTGGAVAGGVIGGAEYVVTPTGGAVSGGAASPSVAYAVTGTGGASLGGDASGGGGAYTETPSGGAIVSGGSILAFGMLPDGTPDEGATLGGTAIEVLTYGSIPTGGGTLGGTAIVSTAWVIATSGGAVLGGPGANTSREITFSAVAETLHAFPVVVRLGIPDGNWLVITDDSGAEVPHRTRATASDARWVEFKATLGTAPVTYTATYGEDD
jgi:hypothetical protein